LKVKGGVGSGFDSARGAPITLRFERPAAVADEACRCEPQRHCSHDEAAQYSGLHFVASPRHADVLLVTGPVTRNMREALERTYHATPDPKWVVAVGDCAVDGGIFSGSYAVIGGVSGVVPVDLHIRGCPPDPIQLLKGLLTLLEAA